MKKGSFKKLMIWFLTIASLASIPGWVYLGLQLKYQSELNVQNSKYSPPKLPYK